MKNRIYLGIFIISLLLGSVFQNCATKPFTVGVPVISIMPYDHPDLNPHPGFQSKASGFMLIDRDGLHSVMSDVFAPAPISDSLLSEFQALFNSEVLMQQHMFGRPCDVIGSGSMEDCGYNLSNLTLAMGQSSSTIREASRIQLCRRLISRESIMDPLVERIQGSDSTLTPESAQRAVNLFFPSGENTPQVVASLMQLDSQMTQNSETIKDRWKLLMLTLCESPFWQVL